MAEGGRGGVVKVGKAVRRRLEQLELRVCTVVVFVDVVVVVVVAVVRNGSRVQLLCQDEVPLEMVDLQCHGSYGAKQNLKKRF